LARKEGLFMGILSDWLIQRDIKIEPFAESSARPGVISYGVSSYGYDIRVGRKFKVFTNVRCAIVDPKHFDVASFVDIEADYCLIPPNSFALAETVEYLEIPRDVLGVCLGKSTYARCFVADTRVALTDGSAPTLEEMARRAETGERFQGYSVAADGRVSVAELEAPRFVARDAIVEVTLDSGTTVVCTPDHRLLTRDGRMVAADDLRPGDSLMPLLRQRLRDRQLVYQPLTNMMATVDRLAAAGKLEPEAELAASSAESISLRWSSPEPHRGTPEPMESGQVRWPIPNPVRQTRAGGTRDRKVAAIRSLPGIHDVYCLTVPATANFALEAGVFVHNCGIIVNVTPLEPEWRGRVTIEISNTTPLPAKIYSGEGIAQILFLRAEAVCRTSYGDKKGKYQDQKGLTLPFVIGDQSPP
jgi:deoxycytidine triphosphate deaminase